MGDIESDWTGVSFTAPEDLVDGTTYACDKVSASNTDFSDQNTDNYDDDSFFYGQVEYSDSGDWVYIIR